MAATTAGAWKAYLEAQGLGVPWYRDGAPPEAPLPYGVIQEGIGYSADPHGDTADPEAHLGTTELVQLDLYQPARAGGAQLGVRNAEQYDLAPRVERLLRQARLLAAPQRVYGVRLQTAQRFPVSDNVVRHRWDVLVYRDTT